MCTCASCEYTDGFSGAPDLFGDFHVPYLAAGMVRAIPGFNAWPRGEPAGKRSSAKAYSAHVAHGKACDGEKLPDYYRTVPKGAVYPHNPALVMPITPAPASVLAWINSVKTGRAEAQPASPETPAKAPRHFPEQDRLREAAKIYAMPKQKPQAKPRGRPTVPGRRVIVKLEEAQIRRLKSLGGGSLTKGMRKLLQSG